MDSTYRVNVNDDSDFQLSKEDVEQLDVIKLSSDSYHVIQNDNSFKTQIVKSDFASRNYKVKINNTTYNVNIFNPLDALIKELGFEIGASKQINEIHAPMPGLILDIHVKTGQEVQENDPLLILEAMKMENVIVSPRAGVIKSISIEKGNAVDKNQLLIEFE